MIIQIVGVALVLGVIVVIHEFGHFLSARSMGIAVQEFAVGAGPIIWSKQGKETLYSVRGIPFGGYCLFQSELEGTDHKGRPLSILGRNALTKIYVSISGPILNFALAALIFAILFSFVGVPVGFAPVIGEVQQDSAAMEAGILPGDRVLSIEGEPLEAWRDISRLLAEHRDRGALLFELERDGALIELSVTPRYYPEENRVMIGVTVDEKHGIIEHYPPGRGIVLGLQQTLGMMYALIEAISGMVVGQVSVSDGLSGPVALTQVIAETVTNGFADTLFLTAFLSVNLGIMNLLPIPALDGGRILIYLVEMLRRKPMKLEVEGWLNTAGFALLITLMIMLTFKDIFRLFGG